MITFFVIKKPLADCSRSIIMKVIQVNK